MNKKPQKPYESVVINQWLGKVIFLLLYQHFHFKTKMSEEYSADELISPEWMDKDFFEKVLRKSEDDPSIQVCDNKKQNPTKTE